MSAHAGMGTTNMKRRSASGTSAVECQRGVDGARSALAAGRAVALDSLSTGEASRRDQPAAEIQAQE